MHWLQSTFKSPGQTASSITNGGGAMGYGLQRSIATVFNPAINRQTESGIQPSLVLMSGSQKACEIVPMPSFLLSTGSSKCACNT